MAKFTGLLIVTIVLTTFAAWFQTPPATSQGSGEISLVMFFCDGPGARGFALANSAEGAATPPEDCNEQEVPGPIEFEVFDAESNALVATLRIDPSTGEATESVPAGSYVLPNRPLEGPRPTEITVEPGQTTYLQLLLYTEWTATPFCSDTVEPAVPGDSEPLVAGGPALKWSAALPFGTTNVTDIAHDGETLVLGVSNHVINRPSGIDSAIVAYDVASGDVRWCRQLDQALSWGDYLLSPLVASNGVVVAALGSFEEPGIGQAVAFDLESGDELWRTSPELVGFSQYSVAGELVVGVIPAEGQDSIVAFDLESGDERWRFTPQETMQPQAPITGDGKVFVPVERFGPAILVLDAATGAEQAFFELDVEGQLESLAYADGTVYAGIFGMNSSPLIALDAVTGAEIWRSNEVSVQFPGQVISDDLLYAVNHSHSGLGAAALDKSTGGVQWQAEIAHWDGTIYQKPVLLEETLLVCDNVGSGSDGEPIAIDLIALDRDSASETWRLHVAGAAYVPSPLVVGDTLFVGGWELIALDMS
jgi:outer membrane protein assembly factor BamB